MARTRKKQSPLADQLRAAIRAAERKGVTRYQIAQRGSLDHSTLTRFYNDPKAQPRIDIAEKIATGLGGKITLDI